MAAPLPHQNILGVFKSLKGDLMTTALKPRGLTAAGVGIKKLELDSKYRTSTVTGYWSNPTSVSSKPPRWIVQVEKPVGELSVARFPTDADGNEFQMARTLGYMNNHKGACSVIFVRILPAIFTAEPSSPWDFPRGWEYLLVLGFASPLQNGTSGDPITEFNPTDGTIVFGPQADKRTHQIAFRGLLKVPGATPAAAGTTYDEVGAAIAHLAGANLFDGTIDFERDAVVAAVSDAIMTAAVNSRTPEARTPSNSAEPLGPFVLAENTSLFGVEGSVYRQIEAAINSGKRHIIFYGPPGTGKTTIAEYLAGEVSEFDEGDGTYLMLTASSAWSAQDLVGGYQPLGNGAIGFIPGALLRNFDKPVIIDELNRCPVDKVLGPMFSILSGQSSVLPCRSVAADPASPFHVVFPERRAEMLSHEHAPTRAWRLICTLNTYDKTQLGQISYALSRRFAWIKMGAPSDLEMFVEEMARRLGINVPTPVPANPIGAMWRNINEVREIGGAPIVDFIRTLRELDAGASHFAVPYGKAADAFLSAFRMCVLPLMDGLSSREADNLAASLATTWGLDDSRAKSLLADCREFAA